jgi:AcrR family transcriptional regulator
MAAVPRAPFRPPRQARSRATLDRLLAAAEALLAEKHFAGATVSEIVARAGSSVGAFYARFPDKEALLECFDERFFASARAQWDAFLAPPRWEGASLADVVSEIVLLLVRKNRANKALLRALALYYRSRPDPRFRDRAARTNDYVLAKVGARLRARPGITHPDPALAVGLGLQMVAAALREQILFDEGYVARGIDDDTLARELARAWLAYLAPGGTHAHAPGSRRDAHRPRRARHGPRQGR